MTWQSLTQQRFSTSALSTQSLFDPCTVCGADDWAALNFTQVAVQLDCPSSGQCGAHFYFEVTEDTAAAREIWYHYLTTQGNSASRPCTSSIHCNRPSCKAFVQDYSDLGSHDLSSPPHVVANCGGPGDVVGPVYDPPGAAPGWCWWSNSGTHGGTGQCPASGNGDGRRGRMWVM